MDVRTFLGVRAAVGFSSAVLLFLLLDMMNLTRYERVQRLAVHIQRLFRKLDHNVVAHRPLNLLAGPSPSLDGQDAEICRGESNRSSGSTLRLLCRVAKFILLCGHMMYASAFFAELQYFASNILDLTRWTFGQVISVTVFLPSVIIYIMFEISTRRSSRLIILMM